MGCTSQPRLAPCGDREGLNRRRKHWEGGVEHPATPRDLEQPPEAQSTPCRRSQMPSWLWEGHAKCLCWEIKEHHNQKHQRPADSGSSPPRIHPLKLDQLQYPQVILPEPQWLCFAFPLHRKAGGTLSPNPAPLEAGHFQTDLGMRKSSMFEMLLCLRAGNGRMTKGEETTRPPHLQGKHCSMTQPRY